MAYIGFEKEFHLVCSVETIYRIENRAIKAFKPNFTTYCFYTIKARLAQDLLIYTCAQKGFCDAGQFEI